MSPCPCLVIMSVVKTAFLLFLTAILGVLPRDALCTGTGYKAYRSQICDSSCECSQSTNIWQMPLTYMQS